jgi:hypothetical protein
MFGSMKYWGTKFPGPFLVSFGPISSLSLVIFGRGGSFIWGVCLNHPSPTKCQYTWPPFDPNALHMFQNGLDQWKIDVGSLQAPF